MDTTQLRLEIVTPMFLRGSDNETPELRPPAFKALFRYWWRAAVNEMNVNTLRKKEADLFGSTKGRSLLSIRIPGGVPPRSDEYAPLPHRDNFRSQALSPNGSFNLTLTAPELREYKKIAKLSFLLGGVGNRSRRGFGSIRYQNWGFQNIDELRNEVHQTLDQISPGIFQQNGGRIDKRATVNIPDYPIILNIYFGNTLSPNIDVLLRTIGQATHDHSNEALGGINPRMASPIHVRIQKVNSQFVPIVTQLHSVFPDGPPANYKVRQQDFINAIIT
ncbi:MAG: type III-B CRISPR module RAMP protein Cmr1 [Gammaproteobacteria bacterium]|nr:type III-B CRISPR module RAMP protein Cmr1 [Candidatus Poribacteria bacterium]MYK42942.1 type III-B CRISPR module RAMP protein Cmr1 [Gammaproteobacteria bacterium]